MPQINQFINEATELAADDYLGVDKKVGSAYVTSKIKKSNAFPVSFFRTSMGNPPLTFAAGAIFSPIIFNATALNTLNEYDTTNGRFTPTKLGIYELSFAVRGQGLIVGDIPSFGIYGGASGSTLMATIQSAAFDGGGAPQGVVRGFTSIIINHSVAGHFYRCLVNNSSSQIMSIVPDSSSSFFQGKRLA